LPVNIDRGRRVRSGGKGEGKREVGKYIEQIDRVKRGRETDSQRKERDTDRQKRERDTHRLT